MEFGEDLDVPLIPVSAAALPGQAQAWAERVAADGADAVRDAAVQQILDTSPDGEPSETRRLHLLYRRAYTRVEIERLVATTMAALGAGGR